ncbi:LPXTG cell wall anchor domain-containing protein [Dubosiella muris]|uniref:LPXTG cell wall anchor domain-containing protein n=1 Tax=Dubosiella muris TaxID=3038133 RepID=A0AC61RAA9_9FIRM|nr:LPXTG cell wall anchor domain-containing protein [Dubosiella muris]
MYSIARYASSANTAVSTRSRLWMSTAGMALSSLGVLYVFKKRKKGK